MAIEHLIYSCAEHDQGMAFTSMKVTMVSFNDLELYLVQIPDLKCLSSETLSKCLVF